MLDFSHAVWPLLIYCYYNNADTGTIEGTTQRTWLPFESTLEIMPGVIEGYEYRTWFIRVRLLVYHHPIYLCYGQKYFQKRKLPPPSVSRCSFSHRVVCIVGVGLGSLVIETMTAVDDFESFTNFMNNAVAGEDEDDSDGAHGNAAIPDGEEEGKRCRLESEGSEGSNEGNAARRRRK